MTTQSLSATPAAPFAAEAPAAREPASILAAFVCLLGGILVLLPHFALGAMLGPFSFLWLALASFVVLMLNRQLAFGTFMACVFLQNMLIAIVAPLIKEPALFSAMQGTTFVLTVLFGGMCLPLWLRLRHRLPRESQHLLQAMLLFLAAVVLYSVLGMANADFMSVAVYARTYLSGILMLIVGVAMGFQISLGFVVNIIRAITVVLVLWGFAEFFFTYELYGLFNVVDFLRIKWTDDPKTIMSTLQDAVNFGNRSYLNLSGMFGLDLHLLRPNGPNLHPISYAYALAFGGLVCFMFRHYILTLGCLALLVLVGAKGPLLMAFMTIALGSIYISMRSPKLLLMALAGFLGLYVVVAIVYGLMSQDYHVIGLMGGVKGFFSNPLGRGVGVGGNLSQLAIHNKDFDLFQKSGAADFALESAFGVIIYQMGVGTFAFLLFYWRALGNIWQRVTLPEASSRLIVVPIALAFLFVNGIFQEETLLPVGWGLWLLLSGFLLAREWRGQLTQETMGGTHA